MNGTTEESTAQARFNRLINTGARIWWGLGGLLVGGAASLIFSWYAFLAPLQTTIAAREASLKQWEELNRSERQTIQDVRNVSVEEMRKWVGAMSEQNTRFSELQRNVHAQERELADGGTSYVLIAAAVVLGSVFMTAWMYRDKNSASDVTLENIAGLTPAQMVTVAQVFKDRDRLASSASDRTLPRQ